jgi:sarcosine oxidase delta subunit
LPALMMEDIAPSDSIQLSSTHAPEEIMTKPRSRVELLPEAERTSADRNRFRNASKRERRSKRQNEQAEAAAASAAFGAGATGLSQKQMQMARLHETKKLEETLRHDKRVILSNDNENPSKRSKKQHSVSSKEYFANFQNTVQNEISSIKKAGSALKSKDKSGPMTAGRVKL